MISGFMVNCSVMQQKILIKRRLFTEEPNRRFSRVFNCSLDIWNNVWKRYKVMDFTEEESRQYLIFILRLDISKRRFHRWIQRTDAYIKAQIAIERGCYEVTEDYFGKLQTFVNREMNKNN